MGERTKGFVTLAIMIVVAFAGWWLVSQMQLNEEIDQRYDEFKTAFMEGCDPDGLATAYCTCAFNDLTERNGKRGVYDIAKQYQSDGILTNEMLTSAVNCYEKL